MTEKIKKRYDELVDLIKTYNRHYYDLDTPLVDDAAYDSLTKELAEIELRRPELKREDSPSGRVGGQVSAAFSEVPHDPPMLSLGNVFDEDELNDFHQRCVKNLDSPLEITYTAELKYDGLAVEVVYRDGKLVQGSTRGNGTTGEDVTANLLTIKKIPHAIMADPLPGYISIRGEVFMKQSEFERLNRTREKEGDQLFANPRNAAAGSLRQLDPQVTSRRELDAVFYGIGRISGVPVIRSQNGLFEFLSRIGVPVSDFRATGTLAEIREFYRYWLENRHTLDFDIDGIVVKVDDFFQRDVLGQTGKAPKWAAAWKFPAMEAITVLESVDYQVGRTGIITPVANLHPINIGGVVVKRASLHNFSEVARLGVKTGSTVKVIRAGDVIPKVIDVCGMDGSVESGDITAPDRCPSCGSALIQEDIYLRCVNQNCEAKKLEAFKFFVSRDGLDIEFFGPELIARLYRAGKLKNISDFFLLTKKDLLDMERMGDRIAEKIIGSIDRRRSVSLSRFLKSLGIRNVGEHVAKVMAGEALSLKKLREMDVEGLMAIREVGPGVAESVYSFFHDEANIKLIQDMIDNGLTIEEEKSEKKEHALISGKTFVFTGSMTALGRKEAEDIVRGFGGRASGSVSKKTDFVVAGEAAGSKLDTARSLGVAVLSEKEFLEMLGRDHE